MRARKIPALAFRTFAFLANLTVVGTRWDHWWPTVWGGSHWTASLQYRALRGGARLGRAIGRENNVIEYDAHATMLLEYIQVGYGLRSDRSFG